MLLHDAWSRTHIFPASQVLFVTPLWFVAWNIAMNNSAGVIWDGVKSWIFWERISDPRQQSPQNVFQFRNEPLKIGHCELEIWKSWGKNDDKVSVDSSWQLLFCVMMHATLILTFYIFKKIINSRRWDKLSRFCLTFLNLNQLGEILCDKKLHFADHVPCWVCKNIKISLSFQFFYTSKI